MPSIEQDSNHHSLVSPNTYTVIQSIAIKRLTLGAVWDPTGPPSAVVRDNPRQRIISQVSPSSNGYTRRAGGKRAVTISPNGPSAPLLKGTDATDPVLLEMKKGLLLNVENVLNQFVDLNQTIRAFCDRFADGTSGRKRLPRFTGQVDPVPAGSPVGKLASEFTSVEDYIFFVLLSIVTSHIYSDIFRPFHPVASTDENERYEKQYEQKIDSCMYSSVFAKPCIEEGVTHDFPALQFDAATWRSKAFSSIETTVTPSRLSALIQEIITSISQETQLTLETLDGDFDLPSTFRKELEPILKVAYNWNRLIKVDILKYDFEPFVVEPSSKWDPVQMEPFERLRSDVRPDRKVISSVSLGLIGSVSLGGARVSHVQQKAGVLVEEWFFNGARERTMSAARGAARARPTAASKPPPQLGASSSSGGISTQPTGHMGMTMVTPARGESNKQDPAPPKKGGLCC